MDKFDDRKKEIINKIANSGGFITGKALSMSLGISMRTVQSEISAINKQLFLINSSNKGYSINKENFALLNNQSFLPKDNNKHIILKKLIFADTVYQIDELADSLFMSTTTLVKKLKSFHSILSKFDLNIVREKACIKIEGDELSKRKLINYLIFKEINPTFNSIDNINQFFPDIDINKIKSIILNSIHKYDYFIENNYQITIIINIAIALYRMKSDNYVKITNENSLELNSPECKISYEICEHYAEHWHITPSVFDVTYISTLLTGQIKPISINSIEYDYSEFLSSKFIAEINDILSDVFNYYMLNINYSDYLYSFALHVDGMIIRAKNTLPVNNELLNNIKKNCPFIYDVSVLIAQKISEKYNVTIADSEIGYISIHIGYLIDSSTESNDKVYVLLFDNDYRHIGDTIKHKLLDNFSKIIEINTFRFYDDDIIGIKSDLIITTKPFNIIGKIVLVISPFYTMMDHINIDNAIHACLKEKKKNYRNQLLSSFFHENLFFKTDDLFSKSDVITFLGQKIIDFGLAEEGFIQSIFERENLSSTCFFDTFAIPHAIDLNAKKTMICVLISERGIHWDDHNIHIVLMIAVQQKDRKEFMKLYNGIVQSLENPEKVKLLVSSDTHMEFINYLKQ